MLKKTLLFCILAIGLMPVHSQSAKDIEAMAKALLTAQKKKNVSSLKPYMLNRANFDKYFKDELMKMMGSEMELSTVYDEIDKLNRQYDEIPTILNNGGYSGKLTYSHFHIIQTDEAIMTFLKQATISLVFKDGKGEFFTLMLGETFITPDDGMIVNPKPTWLAGDLLKGCNCLSGYEFLDDSMVGLFEGDCAFLNDHMVLETVGNACGLFWDYGDYDGGDYDYYAEIDICLCQDHFKNYQLALEEAFKVVDAFERQDLIVEINEEYNYVLVECKEKERMLKEEEGFVSMEALIEACKKD